jgi:xanthine dehydrogenase YagT iron-sulfur-binding subunit
MGERGLHVGMIAPAGPVTGTWVLALTRGPHELREIGGIDGIRAHLRGLGASLVVVSERGAWSLAPDDDPVPCDGAFAAALRRPGRDAIYVIDEANVVRFARDTDAQLGGSLADALAAAARALLQTTPPLMFDRREWAIASLCASFAMLLLGGCKRPKDDATPPPAPAGPSTDLDVVLNVNGTDRRLRIDPRVSLLDALRERLGLTGTKKGCDMGQCGACTVHLDGRAVTSCLVFAAAADGKRITTIEGIAKGDQLHPVQQAFVEHDAFSAASAPPGRS